MKLTGIVKDEIMGFVEIVDIIIKPQKANYAVHMYYYEYDKKIFVTINGKITARFEYPWDGSEIYSYGYNKLLTEERFKDFTLID